MTEIYNQTQSTEKSWQAGRQAGCRDTRLKDIKNLMDNWGVNAEQAMRAMDIPKDERSFYFTELKKEAQYVG